MGVVCAARVDPRHQLGEVERLHQVVIGAAVESRHPVDGVAGRQHENGCPIAAAPGCGNDVEPGSLRHAPVQDGDVVVVRP